MFPLYDGKTLPFHLTVRSTVIEIKVVNHTNGGKGFKFPMILTLSIDKAGNDRPDNLDYCLGVADFKTGKWVCASIIPVKPPGYNGFKNKISYKIPNNGIYAVIFNP